MNNQTGNRLWNKKTKELTPYTPGEQPSRPFIKLNTNENPYPPSPMVKKTLTEFPEASLRLYPDPTSMGLRQTLADYYGIEVGQLFLGNGSDEVLAFAFQTFFDAEIPVAFPDITYSFYPVYCDLFSIPVTLFPLRADFSVPLEDLGRFNGGVVLSNPNAPTGMAVGVDKIRELLLAKRNRLVVVDEAYIDFGGESAVPLIGEFDHLLVVHTMSKSRSLAGLRVGYAMGNPSLIKALERTRDSFNSYTMDTLAQKLAQAAMKDGSWFEQTRSMIIETRAWIAKKLTRLGFMVLPSEANFVFTAHPEVAAIKLYELLREHGILVRYFNKPRIDNFLRISIGTEDEMQKLIVALGIILEKERKS